MLLCGIIHLICAQTFQKTNISYPLIRTRTWSYQGVRNVSVLENFAYVMNDRYLLLTHYKPMFHFYTPENVGIG